MEKILAMTLWAVLYMAIAKQPLKCTLCPKVLFNNECFEEQKVCIAHPKRKTYCYTRLVIYDHVVHHMEKGCTSDCVPIQELGGVLNVTWCCKHTTFCNYEKMWIGL